MLFPHFTNKKGNLQLLPSATNKKGNHTDMLPSAIKFYKTKDLLKRNMVSHLGLSMSRIPHGNFTVPLIIFCWNQ